MLIPATPSNQSQGSGVCLFMAASTMSATAALKATMPVVAIAAARLKSLREGLASFLTCARKEADADWDVGLESWVSVPGSVVSACTGDFASKDVIRPCCIHQDKRHHEQNPYQQK